MRMPQCIYNSAVHLDRILKDYLSKVKPILEMSGQVGAISSRRQRNFFVTIALLLLEKRSPALSNFIITNIIFAKY